MDPRDRADEPPVLVVGAGPVGLTLACELARHGVACRVVDDGDGPTPLVQSRALAVHARTMEMLDLMGLADAALAAGKVVSGLNIHRGGRRIARIVPDFTGLETPFPFILSLVQGQTERLLLERLEALGGSVQWRTRLDSLAADDQGVTVRLTGPDGQVSTSHHGWLVGCDGAHSAVRHQLGLRFEGAAYPEQFLLVDAVMAWGLDDREAQAFLLPDGPIIGLPLPVGGRWRLIDIHGKQVADDPAAVADRLRDDLARAGLAPGAMAEPVWSTVFRIHRRAVDRLRVGRVFLAGDAAHIHSPAGGQGMNAGIQDAVNLAWKLALVIQGRAADALLDSYQAERLPVALGVLRISDRLTRFATLRSPAFQALRAAGMSLLGGTRFLRRMVARSLSGLRVAYRDSPVVAEDGGTTTWSWSGPRPGDRLPDLACDGGRLYQRLRPGRHLLLVSGADDFRWDPAGRPIDVHHLGAADAPLRERLGTGGGPCLHLIRPDGHVGYRCRPPDPARLDDHLERVARLVRCQ